MATYGEKFAFDAGGKGMLAPFLGDPSRFGRDFPHSGYYWLDVHDDDGNGWRIVFADESGHALYDWQQVANHAGTRAAFDAFYHVESVAMQALGLDGDVELSVDPVTSQDLAHPATWGKVEAHLFRSQVKGQPVSPAHWQATDAGPAVPSGNAARAYRANTVPCWLPGKNGAAGQRFYCLVNTWLRIGVIVALPGEVTGGSDWIPQALTTIEDVAKIAFGISTANVMLCVASLADIVKTWWAYVEDKVKRAAANQAAGNRIGRSFAQGMVSRGAPSGAGEMSGPGKRGPPKPLPTAGEVSRRNTQKRTAAVAVGAGAVLWLLFL